MFLSSRLRAGTSLAALLCTFPIAVHAEERLDTIVVTGQRTERDVPNKIESIDAEQARIEINAVNTEDMLKYLPSITVRKRHYGDTQDPLATRTSGVGASARSLLFVDGILISSPIGNNNTSASPHFGVTQPQDIADFQVLYGPFAAEYGGGSMGAVLNITTRMPEHFEVYADILGAVQDFSQYGSHNAYGTGQLSAGMGDRTGAFSWRLSGNHLHSTGQPLAYVTLPHGSAPSSDLPVTGAVDGLNRSGQPVEIIGAGGIEHQTQDTGTLKLAYDFDDGLEATYTVSLFHQKNGATAQTYLSGPSGTPLYAGDVAIDGLHYAIGPSSFSNNVYDWRQTHLAQAFTLKSASDKDFVWEFVASRYDYVDDSERVPGTALPDAKTGGKGSIDRLDGTGWYTLDAKGVWTLGGGNTLSFGAHRDAETYKEAKYATDDWMTGAAQDLLSRARGETTTDALWLQDSWTFAPAWKATVGGRYEHWRAHDGHILANGTLLEPASRSEDHISPKASLEWQAAEDVTLSASWGAAYRMPTVTELYQTVTVGTELTVPNPDLEPEHANSYELAAEWRNEGNRLRLSLFQENVGGALLSQSAIVPGTTTLSKFVQNVDRTRVRGAELVASRRGVLIDALDLSGSVTYADSETRRDLAMPEAEGKRLPQVPKWRATGLATYHATEALDLTLAGRYSARAYGTIENSDPIGQTFQGFGKYFVLDARAHYQIDTHWSAALGVDNLNNDKYFLYHPFPQRTFVFELRYAG